MKLKELESHLTNVENFSDAKEYLEQYMTTPHLGKLFLQTIK
jgi:predicted RNA methylase